MVPAAATLPFRPTPLVRLPCGSMSTRRTRRSAKANEAARLIAVVVLPTPPFWLATAMILVMSKGGLTSAVILLNDQYMCCLQLDDRVKRIEGRSAFVNLCSTWNVPAWILMRFKSFHVEQIKLAKDPRSSQIGS